MSGIWTERGEKSVCYPGHALAMEWRCRDANGLYTEEI